MSLLTYIATNLGYFDGGWCWGWDSASCNDLIPALPTKTPKVITKTNATGNSNGIYVVN